MATFGTTGWPIVPMPSYPSPASLEFMDNDVVAAAESIFTGQQQIQSWEASWMEASVQMPPMSPATFAPWQAWIRQLQGIQGVFLIGDPIRGKAPYGTGAGTPVVSGSNQTGYQLATSGWSGPNALLPGDYIQIGYRLYMNLGTVGPGSQTLQIWPNLRESPLDGTAITVTNTQGLFRLKSNIRKTSLGRDRYYSVQFDIREAI